MMHGSRPLRILLADDHPVVLSGLQALLRRIPGLEIIDAQSDGTGALKTIRTLEPDIAVLDILMPGLTGIEVLEAAESEGLPTRIVFLTASATDENIAAAVRGGAWAIMLKDSAPEDLVHCLNAVAAGERWLAPEVVAPALRREAERREDIAKIDSLVTPREREIAVLVARGLSNKEIARRINISEGTVKIHLHNAYNKLGVANRTSLATLAHRHWVKGGSLG
jgi:two-component system, NarL family, nitrate/nitrite response regulator NarL